MIDIPTAAWISQIPSWLINVLCFALGAGFKSAIDYRLRDRNQENQIERERNEKVRKWNANTQRIIRSIENQYKSTDPGELDERNEVLEELESVVESLKEQKEAAPADISWGTIDQINTVIHEADQFSGKETPVSSIVVNRNPAYPGSSPSRRSREPSNRDEKRKQEFIEKMDSFLEEARKLVSMCGKTGEDEATSNLIDLLS